MKRRQLGVIKVCRRANMLEDLNVKKRRRGRVPLGVVYGGHDARIEFRKFRFNLDGI